MSTRRRKHWGWGFEDEQPRAEDLRAMAPLLREQLAGPQGRAVKNFPIPAGEPAEPGELADIAVFMASPAARAMVGTIVFADGGTDALLRGDHYPAPVKARQLGRYARGMLRHRRGR